MYSLTRIIAIAATAAAIFTVGITQAAMPVDFAPFKGNYKGSWLLSINNNSAITTVSIRVKVPKNGKTMIMTINGTIFIGQNLPIATTLKFAQKRKLTSDAFLMGYLGSTATLPTKYRGKKKSFTFSLAPTPGAKILGAIPISGTMSYSLKFSKKTLTISGSGGVFTNTFSAVTIQIQARKAGK